MKIAALGFCCMDIYEDPPRSYPAGNGIDVVVNLAKRGIAGSAVCAVGNDSYGKAMTDLLKEFGVDTSHMQVIEGDTSRFYMKLTPEGDRIHFKNVPGVMDRFALSEADIAFLQGHDYIHTDLTGRVLDDLPLLRQKGSQIIFDFSMHASDANMAKCLPHVDYAFFSAAAKRPYAREFLRHAKSLGGRVVTATFGEEGSLCYDGDRFYECGIVPAEKVVNTVGAGDAYVSGFMYGIMTGCDIPKCMQLGAETAAGIVARFEPY